MTKADLEAAAMKAGQSRLKISILEFSGRMEVALFGPHDSHGRPGLVHRKGEDACQ
ncbi:MAG: hypothetical protein ACK4M6_05965 [Hyphomonas sp.]